MITALDKNTALVLIDLQEGIVGIQTAHVAQDILDKSVMMIDAMTDSKMEAHQNSIKNIFPRLGEVGDVADIIRKLH